MDKKQREQDKRSKLANSKPYVYEKMMRFDEKIRRGESIAIIQLQYRYVCNLRCQHCSIKDFQVKSNKRSLKPADIKRIYTEADALGLARTTITGGEPLIFKDLDQLVEAIGPDRFYINSDTNGYVLNKTIAKHLKSIGVDRLQISIDSMNPYEHDRFRGKEGSWIKAFKGIDIARAAGLDVFIQTVVTKQRLYSQEFIDFIRFLNVRDVDVFVTFAKPVGAWAGKKDMVIDSEDLAFMQSLEEDFRVCTHLTPAYGLNMGCIAVKGMFSITQYGDVLPCPYMHISIGNVFNESLDTIIKRGFGIKWFGEHVDTCLIAADSDFISRYIDQRVIGKPLPVKWTEVFTEEDATRHAFSETINK